DRETGEIEGMDGFYYTSARRDYKAFDIWGSMWTVRKDHPNLPMLGIQIANEYYRQVGYRYSIGVGVNTETALPLERDHYQLVTGRLNHFYMLNREMPQEAFQIAAVNMWREAQLPPADTLRLEPVESMREIESCFSFETQITTVPFKDAWYVDRRFFHHPVYHYDVFLLKEGDQARAILVMRRVTVGEHYVWRIVDYLGDIHALQGVSRALAGLMTPDCEYIDFYTYGYDESAICAAGFVKRDDTDTNVIPNYFEPFVQRNVDCWFNSDAPDNFVICKADADQDRPNQRRE
ncbi:MAG: hypothetical protein IJT34_01080, partial [Butyrivibrio sp.]|nr:hypothetical protein [Butyrivibrio sp.]